MQGGGRYFEAEEMCEDDETLTYFVGLLRREECERLKFLENFSNCVMAWLGKPDDLSAQAMLRTHLPTALRFSLTAPFEDVRVFLKGLLKEVQVSEKIWRRWVGWSLNKLLHSNRVWRLWLRLRFDLFPAM